MLPPAAPLAERTGLDPANLPEELLRSNAPCVLRGLVRDWPAVAAAREGDEALARYLLQFYRGEPVRAFVGAPEIGGRFFYDEQLRGFNFRIAAERLDNVLTALATHRGDAAPPAIYVGATAVDRWLPGFGEHNALGLGGRRALQSAWLGNRSRVSAHQDVTDNIACVVAGRRRFTLFPPSQLANLYIGPLDYTPAGQAISLVDLHAPDLQRFPRFAQAWEHALAAELEPGDAIFIPSLWWHHVEALCPFNLLVNFWWRGAPAHLESPMNALMLALLSLRDLPEAQRREWQEIFRHYVFEADEETSAHIPPAARRVLAPLDEPGARELRAQLLARLGR
jgi:hypothetical protein